MISLLFKLVIFQVYSELKFSFAFGCCVFADKKLPTLPGSPENPNSDVNHTENSTIMNTISK